MTSEPDRDVSDHRKSSARAAGGGSRPETVCSLLSAKPGPDQIITPWMSVSLALRRLSGPPKTAALLVVGETGRLIGTVSATDIIEGLAEHGTDLLDMSAENVMSHPVPACSPDDGLAVVMRAMTKIRCQHLPVLHRGELVGMISMEDVVRARLAAAQLEAAALRDIVSSRP